VVVGAVLIAASSVVLLALPPLGATGQSCNYDLTLDNG
jgi:hypothetical protein